MRSQFPWLPHPTEGVELLEGAGTAHTQHVGKKEFFSLAVCRGSHMLVNTALYLLLWGEAANVRFLPECLCYLFHQVGGLPPAPVPGPSWGHCQQLPPACLPLMQNLFKVGQGHLRMHLGAHVM